MGVQGAKPPEADKFLNVKDVFYLIQNYEHIKGALVSSEGPALTSQKLILRSIPI
jgi:hypothetical protein